LLFLLAACGSEEASDPDAPGSPGIAVDDPAASDAPEDAADAGEASEEMAAGGEGDGADAAGDAAEAPSAVGIYKGFFPGASSPGLETTLYLNFDGSLQLFNDYLNEEPPIVEIGTWSEADGAVELTLTGQEDRAYDEPETRTLAIGADRLTSADWIGPWWRFQSLATGLEPPYDADAASAMIEERGFLGYYKHFAPSASCCGQDYTLLLGIDDLARLTSNYLNNEPPIVEEGTWSVDEQGRARVELTNRPGGEARATPIVFSLVNEDGLLKAVDYDDRYFGEMGLTFYLYPGLAMAQRTAADGDGEASGEEGSDGGEEIEAGVTPVSPANPDAITGVTWQLQDMQLADASVLTPGTPADYTLRLLEDGSAEIKADCNQGRAGYDLAAPYFSFDQIALTRAQCPPGSLHDSYVEALGAAGSAVLQDGELVLVTAGGGRMRFAAVGE
jgi:uncharacterized lipoprotein NlpE involved in copper resistance/heat shock protein HslJ